MSRDDHGHKPPGKNELLTGLEERIKSETLDAIRQEQAKLEQRQGRRLALVGVGAAVIGALGGALAGAMTNDDTAVNGVAARVERIERAEEALRTGQVIASTRPCESLGNWVVFAEATGRFILGAGEAGTRESAAPVNPYDPDRPGAQFPISRDWASNRGGQRVVTLRPDQLPKHSHTAGELKMAPQGHQHTYKFDKNATDTSDYDALSLLKGALRQGVDYTASTATITGRTGEAGRSRAHNNMPPYIALHLCIGA